MKKKIISDINVTPFVDIMLVLLVVFMVAAPMMVPSVDVDLPTTAPSKSVADQNVKHQTVMISINSVGEIYIQDKLIKLIDIKAEIDKYLLENKDIKVLLRGDKNVSYDTVIHTLVAIKNAGLNNVSLVTNTDS